MGTIFVEGLGIIELEGDTPSEQESQAILEAVGDPEDEGDPTITTGSPPPIPEPIVPAGIGLSTEGTPLAGEGPLGLMPTEARMSVRRSVEEQPGLVQLITEVSPSAAGTFLGATAGAPLGPAGIIGGAMIGGTIGELFAQETGLAPESELNLALAAGGPLFGPAAGLTLKGVKRGTSLLVTKGFPAARTAGARNLVGRAVSEFESIGTTILSKQKGIVGRPASEIFEAAKRAGVRITPNLLKSTRDVIKQTIKELGPVSSLPEVRQSMRALEQISKVMLGNPKGVLLDELIRARSFIGSIIGNLRNKGGIKLSTANKIFATLSDDLDKIAGSPFRKGRKTRLAQAGIKRAKLEFAVKDLENAVAKFTVQDPSIKQGGVRINFKGLQKWLDDITNPKRTEKFNKNFTTALADDLPAIKERVAALAKVSNIGGPGGPGGLVLRGQLAKAGRSVVGGTLGFLGTGGSAVGAAIGAIGFAQLPEVLVGILTTKGGAAFLESAARLGKGEVSWRAWSVASEIMFRSLGEKGKTGEEPTKKSERAVGTRGRSSPRPKVEKPQTTTEPGETLASPETTPKRSRKRLPKNFEIGP